MKTQPKSFTCGYCQKLRQAKSAFIHRNLRLCRSCEPKMRENMAKQGYILERYLLELFCLAHEDDQ